MDRLNADSWEVEITTEGRCGSIHYREAAGAISFYWEFGGGDTVAIIWVGDLHTWRARPKWAFENRRTIIERVALEAVRQKAPACRAEIDEPGGFICLRGPA